MHFSPGTPLLVVTPNVPAASVDGRLLLDDKAVSGLAAYARHWPGRVRCVFREGPAEELAYARTWAPASLPFEAALIPADAPVPQELVADAAIVMASGDNYLDLPLAATCGRHGVPLLFVIEYTLETRLRIAALEQRPLPARLKSAVWNVLTELRRRSAFRRATALAANGTPAARAYAGICRDTITFFDTRTTRAMMATPQELQAKQERLRAGAPLRLGFSGRLEALKGADHLVPVARQLADAGLPFTLDIFGSGSLADGMREQVRSLGLERQVTLHGPVDFETELVPRFRGGIDLFVCCHRQSDPSCTYMEAMGCAVPVAGYGNEALRGLLGLAPVGTATEMDDPAKLARAILALSKDREALARMMASALELSAAHDFDTTFARRIEQCRRVAQRDATPPAVQPLAVQQSP